MFRSIAVPALIAVWAAALITPTKASADDRYYGDRDRGYYNSRDRHAEHEYRERRRNWEREPREHESREHEWREHEWREHGWREHEWREHEWRGHAGSRYQNYNGYYDQFGYWHP